MTDRDFLDRTFNPFANMQLENHRCFLCGAAIEFANHAEHVFPRWLLERFQLYDRHLTLLNRTPIPYRQYVIPCCHTCNTGCLASLERVMQDHVSGGYDRFTRLDQLTIYQWLLKLFYGAVFKELNLRLDRADVTLGNILIPDDLERFKHMHAFLQSIRIPFEFLGQVPWSMFVFRLHNYEGQQGFDYFDTFKTMTIAVRLGDIGIIASLQDNGAQSADPRIHLLRAQEVTLHPMQFQELTAIVAYRAQLLNRIPKYLFIGSDTLDETVTVMPMPLQGFTTTPIFGEWHNQEFVKYLENLLSLWGLTADEMFEPPDRIWSRLLDENRNPVQLNDDLANPRPLE